MRIVPILALAAVSALAGCDRSAGLTAPPRPSALMNAGCYIVIEGPSTAYSGSTLYKSKTQGASGCSLNGQSTQWTATGGTLDSYTYPAAYLTSTSANCVYLTVTRTFTDNSTVSTSKTVKAYGYTGLCAEDA
ncbi:MAG TPA: hypothetical protein VF263_18945 [Longimicrobiaceae bacterium]